VSYVGAKPQCVFINLSDHMMFFQQEYGIACGQ